MKIEETGINGGYQYCMVRECHRHNTSSLSQLAAFSAGNRNNRARLREGAGMRDQRMLAAYT